MIRVTLSDSRFASEEQFDRWVEYVEDYLDGALLGDVARELGLVPTPGKEVRFDRVFFDTKRRPVNLDDSIEGADEGEARVIRAALERVWRQFAARFAAEAPPA